jgi:hypothetical protein
MPGVRVVCTAGAVVGVRYTYSMLSLKVRCLINFVYLF